MSRCSSSKASEDKNSFREGGYGDSDIGSLHLVPVKHDPFQVLPPFWRREFSGKRGPVKHDLCIDQLPPTTHHLSPHGGPHIWSGLVDRITHSPGSHWHPSPEQTIYEKSTVLSIRVFVFKVGRVLVEDARTPPLSYSHHAVSAPRF